MSDCDNIRADLAAVEDGLAAVAARVGALESEVEPWLGVDGQARFRLERLEQTVTSFLHGIGSTVESISLARDRALQVLSLIRGG